ncbi:MAG: TIGR02530 family flagellar biosynthesis protein [Tumebacillaceae bacterium]
MSQEWLLRPVSRPIAPQTETNVRKSAIAGGTSSFQAELNKRLSAQSFTFSAHALERLRVRNIRLTPDDLTRLGGAIDKAAAKGGRESLVVCNDVAYVVSIKNRTVITAVDASSMNDHVFTQIDSAVFA